MKKSFLKIFSVITVAVTIISCDKDFNTVGSDLVDDPHFDLESVDDVPLLAFSKRTGAVQANNLPINALGVYNNPKFGKTTASFVSQLELVAPRADYGTEIEIQPNDSVYLYVPYFSTKKVVNNENIYTLDSIYGDVESSINLKIYENKYYIRDFEPNPNPGEVGSYSQKYYSDDKNLVESNLTGFQLNNGSNTEENSQFKFKKDEIIIYKTDGSGNFLDSSGAITTDPAEKVVKEKLVPGMWINLDKDFFKNKVLLANPSNLINNSLFKDYFRGLYFKAEENSGEAGVLAKLDFSRGYITVQYHSTISTVNTKRSVKIKLGGNRINFFDNDISGSVYETGINNSNELTGDERLYVKGGDGAVSYIELFGDDADSNGIADKLEEIRANNWLINDAYLKFYVDGTHMSAAGVDQPKRIYLFNAGDNTLVYDYLVDNSVSEDIKKNKFIYGGILVKENDQYYYKIRITEQLKKWINSEDKFLKSDMRLGLVVTENINLSVSASLRYPFLVGSDIQKNIPLASAINTLGTILYGNHVNVPEDKKLKLKIYYTKPN
ncbi:DUF4270 domain-containing protein [Flavobacterium proteolyticum]|uniref:DUF4270 domain-containing protein n=1 Tax=Flavobacterium proteolyticum TaxID=2911683 RepID=A0ABR9WNV4_9FLAO|nr:DUF4270 domain-containing protein [Flavobacterium proteolyticum]MBE9575582.1 DUF4270 domain-containing protein [Flavobacterium proteolyticum]